MKEECDDIVMGQIVEPIATEPHQRPSLLAAVSESQPVRGREVLALALLVALCDVTIYRGQGLAGCALLFIAAPALLLLGAPRPHVGMRLGVVTLMLAAISARTVWCGSSLQVAVGFGLIVAFAMTLVGACPHVLGLGVFASQTVLAGYAGLIHYWRCINRRGPRITRTSWLNIAFPLVTLMLFSVIFVFANPNLLSAFGTQFQEVFSRVRDWILNIAPGPIEVLFWCAALWIAVGLLRPVVRPEFFEEASVNGRDAPVEDAPGAECHLYTAFRNTLLTVICLFAAYLAFEFKTLWFREFPRDFHYSGYAHEGAAWLTLALALATAILSFVFRGSLLRDIRQPALRRLAWIWSAENFLLAAAVYNRLYIYINFNGMTRMRIVGIFGMSAVVVGFGLVLWKIAHNRDFAWLLRRHLWTLALAVFLFALTPVDTLWVRYDVWRILSGDLAPSVQIEVHPIDSEGILFVEPLLNCEDITIREGVKSMLAAREVAAETLARQRRELGWTAARLADDVLLRRLRQQSAVWRAYRDPARRNEARQRFHHYAYQWY
jgi:hypothetical protein